MADQRCLQGNGLRVDHVQEWAHSLNNSLSMRRPRFCKLRPGRIHMLFPHQVDWDMNTSRAAGPEGTKLLQTTPQRRHYIQLISYRSPWTELTVYLRLESTNRNWIRS